MERTCIICSAKLEDGIDDVCSGECMGILKREHKGFKKKLKALVNEYKVVKPEWMQIYLHQAIHLDD